MGVIIPRYDERVVANPEQTGKVGIQQPSSLSDMSYIRDAQNTLLKGQKEQLAIELDMKESRDKGIANEFMNEFTIDKTEKLNELKQKYKGANSQGIIDEYKKWQDEYFTNRLGFSPDRTDGQLFLENKEQIGYTKNMMASSLASDINSLSTYIASELQEFNKNQFNGRIELLTNEIGASRDVNNIMLGLSQIKDTLGSHFAGQSKEFLDSTYIKLSNEALKTNITNIIESSETLEHLEAAEFMLENKDIVKNMIGATREDLSQLLRQKQLKMLADIAGTAAAKSSSGKKGKSTNDLIVDYMKTLSEQFNISNMNQKELTLALGEAINTLHETNIKTKEAEKEIVDEEISGRTTEFRKDLPQEDQQFIDVVETNANAYALGEYEEIDDTQDVESVQQRNEVLEETTDKIREKAESDASALSTIDTQATVNWAKEKGLIKDNEPIKQAVVSALASPFDSISAGFEYSFGKFFKLSDKFKNKEIRSLNKSPLNKAGNLLAQYEDGSLQNKRELIDALNALSPRDRGYVSYKIRQKAQVDVFYKEHEDLDKKIKNTLEKNLGIKSDSTYEYVRKQVALDSMSRGDTDFLVLSKNPTQYITSALKEISDASTPELKILNIAQRFTTFFKEDDTLETYPLEQQKEYVYNLIASDEIIDDMIGNRVLSDKDINTISDMIINKQYKMAEIYLGGIVNGR